jgi:multidrug transporter EmrE-like cation transporter
MESHVKILGTLHIVFGSLGILAAVFFLLLFGSIASVVSLSDSTSARDAAIAVPILGGIGTILFVLIGAISLPGLIGGIGLVKLASWSRIFMIVISALDLLSVPIGTVLGIYGIWVLTRPETEALFARQRYQPAA